MTFQAAVSGTPELRGAFRHGVEALARPHRRHIQGNASRLRGSVDLDAHLLRIYPEASRWDYGIGWLETNGRECAIWVEVHHANSGHVGDMVAKVTWLKNWLQMRAPVLKSMTRANGFVWVASGAISFRKGTPQAIRLAQVGLSFPRKQLLLG
jgi:hypothetical protein